MARDPRDGASRAPGGGGREPGGTQPGEAAPGERLLARTVRALARFADDREPREDSVGPFDPHWS